MTLVVPSARRHQLWLVALVAVLALAAFLVWPAGRSQAAPPSNDTCAGAPSLKMGDVVTGSTAEARGDYDATTVTDTARVFVPSGGPDVVFRVTTDITESVVVVVKAQFETTLWASRGGDPCGTVSPDSFGGFNAALGPRLFLDNDNSGPTKKAVTYNVVVAGVTPNDRGDFELVVAKETSSGADSAFGTVGSLISRNTRWDFAESSTRDGLREFITLLSDTNQTVTISYFVDPSSPGFGGVNPIVQTVALTAGQRRTVIANDPPTGGAGLNLDFSFRVTGTAPFQAAAVLYSNRDVGVAPGVVINGASGIQGQHN